MTDLLTLHKYFLSQHLRRGGWLSILRWATGTIRSICAMPSTAERLRRARSTPLTFSRRR